MKKNDLIKTENGIFRILSIEANRVLAIDCIKKTMPKFYPVSSFENGDFVDCLPADFPDMEDLSPAHRKVAQERYTMIASAVSVVDDVSKRNLMIEKSAKQFGMSKQSIRSFLCSYLVHQDIAVLAPKQSKEKELTKDQKNMRWALNKFFYTRNQNSLPTAYAMMRTTVKGIGQIETDEIYVGVDKSGRQYIVPVQAKGGTDKLGISQIEQDLALCAEKYPDLICKSIACQFISRDTVAMFEFAIEDDRIVKVNERHYKLVDAASISSDDLQAYNTR